jgi:hypothetical protein
MAKTKLVTPAASPAKTAITTKIATKKVVISEDPSNVGYPTSTFSIRAPLNSDDAILVSLGDAFVFECPYAFWPAGKVIGYITPTTGTPVFQQFDTGV